MKTYAKFNIVIHAPQTPDGVQELQQRVATAHAQSVIDRLTDLDCNAVQKIKLLDEIIKSSTV